MIKNLREILYMIFICVMILIAFLLGRYTTVEQLKLLKQFYCENYPYVEINGTKTTISEPSKLPVEIPPFKP